MSVLLQVKLGGKAQLGRKASVSSLLLLTCIKSSCLPKPMSQIGDCSLLQKPQPYEVGPAPAESREHPDLTLQSPLLCGKATMTVRLIASSPGLLREGNSYLMGPKE